MPKFIAGGDCVDHLDVASGAQWHRLLGGLMIRAAGVIVLALAAALVCGQAAFAATIPVTSTLDSGAGALRTVIASAAPGDTIVFSVTGVITLTNGAIRLDKNLSINGPGALVLAVSGNNASGVFSVTTGSAVRISNLAIAYGNAAPAKGGGINNSGTLTVTDSILASNAATHGGGIYNATGATLIVVSSILGNNRATPYYGGGIFNEGVLTVTGSSFISNTANLGGAIINYDTVTVIGSSFISNTATGGGSGGAIYNSGKLTMTTSTVRNNTASTSGGGIYSADTMTLISSTVRGNTATYGGGINNEDTLTLTSSTLNNNIATHGGGFQNSGKQYVNNSTIANNVATYGGGINNTAGGKTKMSFSTIVSNTATNGSGIYNDGSILDVRLGTTIIANELAGSNCAGSAIVSDGHSLSSDATCVFTATGDITNTLPLLGVLQNNGGPTLTMAALPGSPVIDAGGDICLATDQRGVSRPKNAHCDIGAVETPIYLVYLPIVQR